MHRKHFKALAALLKAQKKQFKSDRAYAEFCIQLGYTMQSLNNRFDMNKFLEACHNDVITAKDLI